MKKLSLFLLVSVFAFCGCGDDDEIKNNDNTQNDDDSQNEVVISFEKQLTEPGSEFKTTEGEIDGYYTKCYFKDIQNIVEFPHYYSSYQGNTSFGGGFTYTNHTDITTPGYSNISAITAKGKDGKVYLTSNTNSFTPAQITNLQPDKYDFKGAWITNSTYAYLAIKDGNDGYLNQTKFEANDWFKIRATGYNTTGKSLGYVDFYLADYRNGKTEIINTWQWFDWSSISNANYIKFEMSSTDNDPDNGMNTPSYFCLDGITLIEK